MTEQEQGSLASADQGERGVVQFHYIKSAFFRVIHVDGAYGGITPTGYIHAALFNDRRALPQITQQRVMPDGKWAAEETVLGKNDIVRELEVDLILDVGAAKRLGEWLLRKSRELEEAIASVTEEAMKP